MYVSPKGITRKGSDGYCRLTDGEFCLSKKGEAIASPFLLFIVVSGSQFLCQQLNRVLDPGLIVLFLQTAADLHHATGAIHGDAIGTAVFDIPDFIVEYVFRDVRMAGKRIRAAKTAAAIGVFHFDQLIAGRLDQSTWFLPDTGAAFKVAGIVVGDFFCSRQTFELVGRLQLIDNEAGGIDGDLRQALRLISPLRVVVQMLDEITLQRHGAGRAGGDDEIGIVLEQGVDILLRHLDRGLLVAGVERRDAAAILLFRVADQHIEPVHHGHQIDAELRVDEVVGTATIEGDPVARLFDRLRQSVEKVTQRLCGDRRQGAPFGQRREEERQVADGPFAPCDRLLQQAGSADQGVEQLAVTHHLLEDNRLAEADPLFISDLFSQGEDDLETKARQAAEDEILTAALEDGILEQAQINAENYLISLFRSLGYPDVKFLGSETGN